MNHYVAPTTSGSQWKRALPVFAALLITSPVHAQEESSVKNDLAWLQSKGTLIFEDTFDRDETGNGLKDIGNGWESATADRVPHIKQADLDEGILKISSATKEAGHAAHIHHDAGFADGGALVRFRFPGINKAENLQVGFVDRELQGVHAGHLCYAVISQSNVTLMDSKTGSMNLDIRKQQEAAKASKTKISPELEALLASKKFVTPIQTDTEWHEFTLVTEGNELRFSLDGKLVAAHRSEGYAHNMKRWFSFLANSTVWIDDVKIWRVK
ncbi:MAG: hypothetical protein WCO60_00900 [Verrucomicrobiota bacterium]